MEEGISKVNFKISRCTHRRLTIQHEINENHRKQNHLSSLHSYRHREQIFQRKITHLKKTLGHIESYIDDNDDDLDEEQSLMAPNCLARVQNHFRLLNFSSETEKRLLCQTPSNNKPNPFLRRPSLAQLRPSTTASCRSARNLSATKSNLLERQTFQSYLEQQIIDEQQKQMKINKRKSYLLKEFDELKHTIDDPYAALSVLAALSRTFLMLDSATE